MNALVKDTQPPAKHSVAGDTWIQITFTIDPEHYRVLWDRAEAEHRTVPGFVRESIIVSLEVVPIMSHENKTNFKAASRRRP